MNQEIKDLLIKTIVVVAIMLAARCSEGAWVTIKAIHVKLIMATCNIQSQLDVVHTPHAYLCHDYIAQCLTRTVDLDTCLHLWNTNKEYIITKDGQ
jgi:hypothetical protein